MNHNNVYRKTTIFWPKIVIITLIPFLLSILSRVAKYFFEKNARMETNSVHFSSEMIFTLLLEGNLAF
jgi:hypothetical protein